MQCTPISVAAALKHGVQDRLSLSHGKFTNYSHRHICQSAGTTKTIMKRPPARGHVRGLDNNGVGNPLITRHGSYVLMVTRPPVSRAIKRNYVPS
jgi:hypothetical protein